MTRKFNRLLLTGAAGSLGSVLRKSLAEHTKTLRITDKQPLTELATHEEFVQCDLADYSAVLAMMQDVDMVVHFGGVAKEGKFQDILHSNIEGSYHIYEAARRQGVKRIIYASSNHAVGFYDRTETIDALAPHRPDSLYGLSKCFVEDLGRYYYDKFAIESVHLRIGSCFAEPKDRRMLATWLSYNDLTRLVACSLQAPRVGNMIIYGISNNRERYWDNRLVSSLGFVAEDSAEVYRDKLMATTEEPSPDSPAMRFHGGNYAGAGHFEEEE